MPSKKSKPSVCFEPANTADGYEHGYNTGRLSKEAANLVLSTFVRQQAIPRVRTYAECEAIGTALRWCDVAEARKACMNAMVLAEFDLFSFILAKNPGVTQQEESYEDLVYRVLDRSLEGDDKWLGTLIRIGFPVSTDRRPAWDLVFAMAKNNPRGELMRTLDILDTVSPTPKGQEMLNYLMENYADSYQTLYPIMCVAKRAQLEISAQPPIPLTSEVELG